MTENGIRPRIERLSVKNFRTLRDLELTRFTPMTVLIGPNGSGKSTVFDVFAFLAECFDGGLRRAWDRRGGARNLRSRAGAGPVVIEIAYREQAGGPLIIYRLEVDEERGRPVVARERLGWRHRRDGTQFRHLDVAHGVGRVVSGSQPDMRDAPTEVRLRSRDTLAVSVLGQLAEYPRVVALRDFIVGWQMSRLSSENARGLPEVGPDGSRDNTGGCLAAVVRYVSEEHSEVPEFILDRLRRYMPQIQGVKTVQMPDGRLLVQIRDAPFSEPITARTASDGTLRMLAYLLLLHNSGSPPFIGIEGPERCLSPRLVYGLADECRVAANATQILATTHSPFFLDALHPAEVRVLWRDENGYTRCDALADDQKIKAFMDAGAQLGDLWMEGHFGVGDPLTLEGTRSPGRRIVDARAGGPPRTDSAEIR